ncbi:Uncharacterised protein [Shigella sonnei]|nr:Uncharacterised protein [Shigella sonnei]
MLQAALDVVIAVQAVALLAARQAGVNREGKSAVCGILIERFIERSRCDINLCSKSGKRETGQRQQAQANGVNQRCCFTKNA